DFRTHSEAESRLVGCGRAAGHTVSAQIRLEIDSGGDDAPVTAGASPRLSWTLPATIGAVTGSRLEAEIDGEAQLVRELGTEHRSVPWPWAPLRSRTQVRWRVAVRGTDGEVLSDWSAFEVGLLDEDWKARWISPVEGADSGFGKRPAYALGARIHVSSPVRRARLYTT